MRCRMAHYSCTGVKSGQEPRIVVDVQVAIIGVKSGQEPPIVTGG